jgi:hypothetical protein
MINHAMQGLERQNGLNVQRERSRQDLTGGRFHELAFRLPKEVKTPEHPFCVRLLIRCDVGLGLKTEVDRRYFEYSVVTG